MKGYEKPMVMVNDGLSEGVYAASGAAEAADCWTVDPVSVQDWNGSHHVFEIRCVHSTAVQHISSASTVTLNFNNAADEATTKSISCIGATISCTKTVNVQGNGGDGN